MGQSISEISFEEEDVSDLMEEVKAEDVGYNLVKVKGVPQNPLFDVEKFENMIDTFETRDDDVFICTYVKAGTTWCQQIVTLLVNGGYQGDKSYGEQCPWVESLCAREILPEREAPGYSLQSINEMASPRYFKSHAVVWDLPRGKAEGVKTIAVARNPKDTCVSLFHHSSSKPEFGYKGDFGTFMKVFLSGNAENGSWFKHICEWHMMSLKDPKHCLWLTYEEIIADHRAAVIKIAKFLGLPTSGPVIDKTVENSTMESMKSNKKSNIGLNHLRKGGVGGWRDEFTVTQSNLFDSIYKKKMAQTQFKTSLKFDFGEGLVM